MSALNNQSQLITPDGNNRTVQYPSLEQPTQYLQIDEVVPDDKTQFLIRIYASMLIVVVSAFIAQLLSLMHWFVSIVVVVHKQYQRYANYTEVSVRLRFTFWVFLGLLLAQILITFLLRRTAFVRRFQQINFILFTSFVSLILVGITGRNIRPWRLHGSVGIALLLLGGIIVLLIAQIANIKYKIISLEEKTYLKCVLVTLVVLNMILALCMNEIPSLVLMLELLIPYPIYYFIQLNSSIKDELEVPDHQSQILNQVQRLLAIQNNTDEELANAPAPHKDYIMIKKSHLITSLTILPLAGFTVLSIFYPYFFSFATKLNCTEQFSNFCIKLYLGKQIIE